MALKISRDQIPLVTDTFINVSHKQLDSLITSRKQQKLIREQLIQARLQAEAEKREDATSPYQRT